MSSQLELPWGRRGGAPQALGIEQGSKAVHGSESLGASGLLGRVLDRQNLQAALKRVRQNQGSPGIDGMTVEELPTWLRAHWPRLREQLVAGTYRPQPVRRHLIPKESGGTRQLGIPTVLDRFLQQALLQVLQPLIDPSFSDQSYGFRPGRGAHGAMRCAQRYVAAGYSWVVDLDLEKFFDRVHHDILMERLARRVADRPVLRLVRRYLEAGVMVDGVKVDRREGTPQGGPLSPLLANVLLDEVDQELERRGHRFVRYADDCNVYVRSKRAGERVMAWMVRAYGRLRLRVHPTKSAVDRATRRSFLGFSFWTAPDRQPRCRVAPGALRTMKKQVRRLSRRSCGRSLAQVAQALRVYLVGWKAYFRLAETPGTFRRLDRWIRHRLRALQLKHWKRGKTVFRELRARGISPRAAAQAARHARSWWKGSITALNIALPNRLFDELGLPRLAA